MHCDKLLLRYNMKKYKAMKCGKYEHIPEREWSETLAFFKIRQSSINTETNDPVVQKRVYS